ncbi:unnamed protein product [Anisakis simplex]|uniref:Nucleoid-structuring protein H-NS n=1 Tax=Anisakis simplex TaxID=6269 RepID=A0A0M3JAG7_ANISI|nr:unnamed protein product [Anisakis simplex]
MHRSLYFKDAPLGSYKLSIEDDKPVKKLSKGEDLLELLDEAAKRPSTAKRQQSSGSRAGGIPTNGARLRKPSAKRNA